MLLKNLKRIADTVLRSAGRPRWEDLFFPMGLFLFSVILIIGLFPRMDTGEASGRNFFLFAMMAVPIIAAIYFIIISFRRKLGTQSGERITSIRFKIALAFVFVAILPSLPIILVSNNILSHTIRELITERTTTALEESIKMSREVLLGYRDDMLYEIRALGYGEGRGFLSTATAQGRSDVERLLSIKGYGVRFFYYTDRGPAMVEERQNGPYDGSIVTFLRVMPVRPGYHIHNISAGQTSLLLGIRSWNGTVTAVYRPLPDVLYSRIGIFEESLGNYKQKEYLKPYFQTGVGIFLLILAILIVIVAIGVSLLLSKNITRPVLELEAAAREVAAGNFKIHLFRDSPDELALLFDSFNKMANQLEESRKIVFHTQKLEAWRDVARKLVHEIKNPLTPIRLSAERIQRRYRENHGDIGEIIVTGTDTIIDEVKVLMKLLSEFSRFARLPELNPLMEDVNPIIESCVNFFHGHEKVNFHLELEENPPKISLDRVLIRQALTNILQNAVDALSGGGNVYVRSVVEEHDGERKILIRIRDDGVGINSEEMEKIFEPTYSTKEHGTGLGLTIVEKIVYEHRGKISCASSPGEGTEFTIELPAGKKEEGNDGTNTGS